MQKSSHSVHNMQCHLILVIKYRKKVVDNNISKSLESIFERVGANYSIEIEEWNHDVDHIHVLFSFTPKTEMVKFLNSYKSASSRLIKRHFPSIKNSLWQEMFWSRSYYLATVGENNESVVRQYIAAQGSDK